MGCTQLLLLALFAVFADLICNCFRGTCDRGCRGVTGTHPSPCPPSPAVAVGLQPHSSARVLCDGGKSSSGLLTQRWDWGQFCTLDAQWYPVPGSGGEGGCGIMAISAAWH